MAEIKQYPQNYRKEWEKLPELKEWLQPVCEDKGKAYCRYCKISLKAKLFDLKHHGGTQKHKSAAQPFSDRRQRQIQFPKLSDTLARKQAQASICLFIAEHCAILAVDHLGQLCKTRFKGSKACDDFNLHRTKCSSIIRNILGEHFTNALICDISDAPFSLIIDESTDISVMKKLGIIVRYFSTSQQEVVSTFLALIELENGTAANIVEALNSLFNKLKLKKKNLLALGTDNAAVMTGINNGVYQKIKDEWDLPSLILIKCTCHSMQLALSAAYEQTLPRNIDFLIKEIYSWFSCSTKRQLEYNTLYRSINDAKNPLKIPKTAETRWISIEPAIRRIVEQWDELRLHFNLMKKSCYSSDLIYNMLCDHSNYCYMVYLKAVLHEVQKVTKCFESEDNDPTKLLDALVLLIKFLASKIVNPTARVDIFKDNLDSYLDPDPYLGYEFNKASSECSPELKVIIKKRCICFTLKLLLEVRNRLPDNISILQKMSTFAVDKCLNPLKDSIVDLAECMTTDASNIDKIINQWKNIHVINWINKNHTVKFWCEVRLYRDASGENPFKELADLAFKFLVLPHSNAEVERLFSQMSLVKNKTRNRMLNPTLTAILGIRAGLKRMKKDCATYEVPSNVIEKIGSKEVYTQIEGDDEFDNLLL